jgi:hypothetical protein
MFLIIRTVGYIPESFENLRNLTRLCLNDNNLSGSIPPCIGELVNLKDLHLNRNQLTGYIPLSLGVLHLDNFTVDKRQLHFYEKQKSTCRSNDECKNRLEYRHFLPNGYIISN